MEGQPREYEPQDEKMVEYINRIKEVATETGIPADAISETEITIGAEMLTRIYYEYGDPDSENYKTYHNDQHALNSVLRRGWRLLNLLQETFPEKFSNKDYGLMLFGALGHDIVHGTGGPIGEDERQSGIETTPYMRRAGYGGADCSRVQDMIDATRVAVDAKGSIVQTNIRSGSKDPLKLVLATADINGIAMEGIPTMINDAFNLYMEIYGQTVKDMLKDPRKVIDFFFTQAKFLDDRLKALDGDFAFYFTEEEVERVKAAYEHEFTGATRDAIGAAEVLHRFPNVGKLLIEEALKATDKVKGSSMENLTSIKKELGRLLIRRPRE